ncbi:DUF2993 domain-containing protein [Streptomyces sp. NPDC000658]|uniref:LmeA family phospholipid-binding protein n=1 Tax=Streptomyces sp. NPDC000658 TaxID=3154266 RepID=UPI00332D2495
MNRRPARARKRLLWATLTTGALITLLPAADRFAAVSAEHRLADHIADRQSTVVGTPQVSIDAFPFLLSAAEGSFSRVTVRADALTGQGRPVQASVELNDVSEQAGSYRAATADARFTAPFSSFGAGLGPDTSLSEDGHGRLRIQRQVLGLPLTVTAQLRLSGRTVSVVPVAASIAGRPVDPAGPRIHDAFAGQNRTLPKLPAGLEPMDISVAPAGVVLHAHGNDIRLIQAPPE